MTPRDNLPAASGALKTVVAAHLAEWEVPHVELDIHGTSDAGAIADAVEAACLRYLGSTVACPSFYESSVGAVAGFELADGRRVVLKAHQSHRPEALLREIIHIQSVVSKKLGLAPAVLVGPFSFGNTFATFENYVDVGTWADPHEPPTREALARSLHSIVAALLPLTPDFTFPSHLLPNHPDGPLWPTPHSKLFDFAATRTGADDIDAVAQAARSRMLPAGRIVIAHGDWRAEHIRFEENAAVVAFDWDSLCKTREAAIIGFTAHAFCADWSRDNHVQAPTVDEACAFVRDYEEARGQPFDHDESALCSACFAYSKAEAGRPDSEIPRVGVVIAKDGNLLGTAFRGETGETHHAEFVLLEHKLKDADLRGATAYTTLEPCCQRGPEKTPCAQRLVDRGITKVFIGTYDMNPQIYRKAWILLRDAHVELRDFPLPLRERVLHGNRSFQNTFNAGFGRTGTGKVGARHEGAQYVIREAQSSEEAFTTAWAFAATSPSATKGRTLLLLGERRPLTKSTTRLLLGSRTMCPRIQVTSLSFESTTAVHSSRWSQSHSGRMASVKSPFPGNFASRDGSPTATSTS